MSFGTREYSPTASIRRDHPAARSVSTRVLRAALAGVLLWFAAHTPARAQECAGDCSSNRSVTIDELVRCVSIALSTADLSLCTACDTDSDGVVGISELVQSVRAALGTAILESNGRCLRPGASGLVPCAEGTVVRVARCDDPATCLESGEGAMIRQGTLGSDGTFALPLDVCQVTRATIIFTAEVENGNEYRVIDLGPGSTSAARPRGVTRAPLTDVEIDPASEAAVRLIDETGLENCGPTDVLAIKDAVSIANSGTAFANLGLEAAVERALSVANEDPGVQAVIGCGEITPTATATSTSSATATATTQAGTPTSTAPHTPSGTPTNTATPTATPTPPPSVELNVEVNPDPVRRGETLQVLVTVTNSGTLPIEPVEVEVRLPMETLAFSTAQTSGATVTCIGDQFTTSCAPGERLVWTLDRLNPGTGVTLSMPPALTTSASVTDGTEIRFDATTRTGTTTLSTARGSSFVLTERRLELTLDDDVEPIEPDGLLTYRLSYGNPSTMPAQAAVMTLPLPAEVELVRASDGGIVNGDGDVEWTLGTVATSQGGSRQIVVRVRDDIAEGTIIVAAARVEDSGGGITHANTATRVERGVPLDMRIELNPDPVRPGELVDARLTVTNRGATELLGVEAEVFMPDSVEGFGTNTVTGAPASCFGDQFTTACNARERLVFTAIPALPAGSGVTLSLPPDVASSIAAGRLFTFNARVRETNGTTAAARASLRVETNRLELTLDDDVEPIAPGALLTYRLSYGNPTTTAAQATTLRLPLPVGVEFVSASDGGVLNAQTATVEWDLATVGTTEGGRHTVVVQVNEDLADGAVIAAAATIADSSARATRATTDTRVEDGGPLALSLELNPDPARPGELVDARLTVTNTGTTELLAVEAEVFMPDSVDGFGTNTTTGAPTTCLGDQFTTACNARERLVYTVGSLPAGGGVTLSLPPDVAGNAAAGRLFTFNARARETNGTTATARASVRVEANRLELTLDDDVEPIAPGELLTYRLSYGNPTTTAAQATTLRLPLPVGVEFVSASDGGALNAQTATVEWDLATVGPAEGGRRTVVVQVNNDVVDGAVIGAEATIEDSLARATRATTDTRVEDGGPLALSLELNPDPARPGELVDARLTVTNTGNTALLAVEAEVFMPDSVDGFGTNTTTGAPASCLGDQFTTACNARERLVYTVGSLPAGSGVTLSLPPDVAGNAAAGRLFTFNARARETNGMTAAARASLRVDANRLELTLDDDVEPIAPGELLTYRLSYGNPTTTAAQTTTLRLPLPDGVEFVSASDGGALNAQTATVEWDLATVAQADGGSRTVVVQVNEDVIDGAVIGAEATIEDSLARATRATTDTRVEDGGPLTLSLELNPDPARPTELVDARLTVTNTGNTALLAVEVEVFMPDSVDGFGTNTTTGAPAACVGDQFTSVCNARERLVFTVESLPAGGGVTLSLPPDVADNAAAGRLFTFNARARETNGMTAAARASLRIDANRLELALDDDVEPIAPGEQLTYRLSYGNPTTVAAQAAILRLPLPPGVELMDASDGGALNAQTGAVEWNLATVSPTQGGTRTATVLVNDDVIDGDVIAADATIEDSSGQRTRATTETRVEQGVPLALSLELVPESVQPGAMTIGSLQVSNLGALELLDVSVEVFLPDGIPNFGVNLTSGALASCLGDQFATTCSVRERLVWTQVSLAGGASTLLTFPPSIAANLARGRVLTFNARAEGGSGLTSQARGSIRVANAP